VYLNYERGLTLAPKNMNVMEVTIEWFAVISASRTTDNVI